MMHRLWGHSRCIIAFAPELATQLLPKVGVAWMPKGSHLAVMTPGQHRKHYLAGALDLATGTLHHCLGPRRATALCRDLPNRLDASYPTERSTRLSVGVHHGKIHQAMAVELW